jgi:hypothetical protein
MIDILKGFFDLFPLFKDIGVYYLTISLLIFLVSSFWFLVVGGKKQ